jgi:hypothetical protein
MSALEDISTTKRHRHHRGKSTTTGRRSAQKKSLHSAALMETVPSANFTP